MSIRYRCRGGPTGSAARGPRDRGPIESRRRAVGLVALILFLAPSPADTAAAADSAQAASEAVLWLESAQTADGSWGAAEEIRALAAHADDLSRDRQALLDGISDVSAYGRSWGLSSAYAASALDTALALMAWGELGVPAEALDDVTDGMGFLVNTKSSSSGWHAAINFDNSWGDPVVTALAVRAYAAVRGSVPGRATSTSSSPSTRSICCPRDEAGSDVERSLNGFGARAGMPMRSRR